MVAQIMFDKPKPKASDKLNFLKGSPVQIICLSFIAVILTGAVLLMLPISTRTGDITSFADAVFTATSATCVTGLVVHDTYLYWSFFGQLVILTLIQIGGLGLVTLTSFFSVMIGKKLGFRGMDLAKESVNTESFADVKKMIRTVMLVTFTIEALGAIVLGLTFIPKYGKEGIWFSIFLSISAFCNAGFDLLGQEGPFVSLVNYASTPQVYIPIALLVVFGGLGFIVWRELFLYYKTKKLSLHTRIVLVMTGSLILIGTIVFTYTEWNNEATTGHLSNINKIGAGFFQSVTTRTAGFNTIDQAGLTDISKMFSIVLMFIGAAPASTGGGIKVTTIAVIAMTIVCVMRGKEDTIVMKRIVDKKAVYKSFTLFFLALMVVITSSLIIYSSMATGANGIDVVFETVSAFATAGLSSGVTAEIGIAPRYLLVMCMYLGRVGPLSMVVSLALRGSSNKEILPQGRIIIG